MIVEFSSKNIGPVIVRIGYVRDRWRFIRRDTLRDTVTKYKGHIYDWIIDSGEGSWPDFHPMTRQFVLNRAGDPRWERRGRILGRHNWNWLTQFVRDRVSRSGTRARVEFGKAKTSRLRGLEEHAQRVESGHETQVTPDMRRLFGATQEGVHGIQEPGDRFFPLRADTAELEIQPHPIMIPVFRKHGAEVGPNFEEFFRKNLKEYEKRAR